MNDPREFSERFFPSYWQSEAGTNADEQRALSDEVLAELNRLRHNVRVGSFTRDSARGSPGSARRLAGRGFAKPAMWAHYGDLRPGACLVLHHGRLLRALRDEYGDVLAGAVAYKPHDDPTKAISTSTAKAMTTARYASAWFNAAAPELLFVKSEDWAYEREYRTCLLDRPVDEITAVGAKGVILAVVVGTDFPSHQDDGLRFLRSALGLGAASRVVLHPIGLLDATPYLTT